MNSSAQHLRLVLLHLHICAKPVHMANWQLASAHMHHMSPKRGSHGPSCSHGAQHSTGGITFLTQGQDINTDVNFSPSKDGPLEIHIHICNDKLATAFDAKLHFQGTVCKFAHMLTATCVSYEHQHLSFGMGVPVLGGTLWGLFRTPKAILGISPLMQTHTRLSIGLSNPSIFISLLKATPARY